MTDLPVSRLSYFGFPDLRVLYLAAEEDGNMTKGNDISSVWHVRNEILQDRKPPVDSCSASSGFLMGYFVKGECWWSSIGEKEGGGGGRSGDKVGGRLGFTYGKPPSTNNLRSFSIFLTDENDESFKEEVSDVQTDSSPGECIYPRSPALGLGLMSAVALMVAQAIINTVAGCICCLPTVFFIPAYFEDFNGTLRVTFIIAFLLLLTGAALNDQRGQENMYFGSFCYVVKPGVFSGGAVLSLASVALAIVYYVALTSSKGPPSWGPQQNQGISMGQPVIPQQSSEPVFVHEDTYNRQQFP
ncbi:hypothetical protein TRIUR3_00818 [Triticum urartu]|uniref:Uncharacterized protein n=1 Tax=Triticum urartu TaxID=4572 RepID=M7ZHZ9_TRIUA|nr:hypothetical protein TRIUR3_00818 [Triticum urartu]